MTTDELIRILTAWRATITAAEHDIERYITPLGVHPESVLYNLPWGLMDAYTRAVSAQVGDGFEWLSWYWADNDMGAKAHEAKPPCGTMRKVKTIKQLARIIEESSEE